MNVKKLYKGLKKSALDEDPWATRTKDATSGEKWGPTGTQLNELARATTYGPEVFNEIFNVLYFRLDERKEKWRKCFKALIVLEFFLLRGDKHCVNPIRIGRFAPKLRELTSLVFIDPVTGEDAGARISKRARDILELAEDAEDLEERRAKAANTRSCVGISSDDNIGGVAREETYTAGRNSFKRNLAEGTGGADDWGSNNLIDSPGAGGGVVPRSLIDSPEVRQVKVSRDAYGRVRSIEAFGLEGLEQEHHAPAGQQPAGAPVARRVRRNPSSRRLSAPPAMEPESLVVTAADAAPAAVVHNEQAWLALELGVQEEQTNPFGVQKEQIDAPVAPQAVVHNDAPVAPQAVVHNDAPVAPQAVVCNDAPLTPQEDKKRFDLFGFDFGNLDLDTSQSPYKGLGRSEGPPKGPTMNDLKTRTPP